MTVQEYKDKVIELTKELNESQNDPVNMVEISSRWISTSGGFFKDTLKYEIKVEF